MEGSFGPPSYRTARLREPSSFLPGEDEAGAPLSLVEGLVRVVAAVTARVEAGVDVRPVASRLQAQADVAVEEDLDPAGDRPREAVLGFQIGELRFEMGDPQGDAEERIHLAAAPVV